METGCRLLMDAFEQLLGVKLPLHLGRFLPLLLLPPIHKLAWGGSCCCYTVSFITIQTGDHKKLISDSSPPHPRITCRPDMYRYVQVCTNVLPLFTSPICRAKRHKSHQLVCWANETASHRLLRDANEQLIRRPARGEREREIEHAAKSLEAPAGFYL